MKTQPRFGRESCTNQPQPGCAALQEFGSQRVWGRGGGAKGREAPLPPPFRQSGPSQPLPLGLLTPAFWPEWHVPSGERGKTTETQRMKGALFTSRTAARRAGGGSNSPRPRPPRQDSTGPPQRLPAPEKVLCERNLYANVVLLLLRHPCPRGWGHLKVLSKALCRALSRAGLPAPYSGPLTGLPSDRSRRSPSRPGVEARRPHRPPSGTGRGRGRRPAGPRRATENEPAGLRVPAAPAPRVVVPLNSGSEKKIAGTIDTWSPEGPGRAGQGSKSF